ncbi:pyridoxamine 5'-phosphate oxidase family protein [Pseudoflavonifractor sp. MSJ-37]|uniref:pyridoxamine 5'-phosphate oxidase family protein n=1 Tax=Pseudoflavonifractor sp. MSJ-37 TaxID=2841531 RepID=UPI001C0FB277|nr:pyridoxamine 5'-phosphate oxidase family protein [Pseudoflavonifractor sp. MSJ-37]MBU5434901.1 pyridoxamine 5'-phosphate oxidase family protein [Pseudoflavonifractor sp. MSJ-37]
MRRKDRAMTDPAELRETILACDCCRLGLWDEDMGEVYLVPMNFGYEEAGDARTFYFHSAREGRKVDLLRRTGKAGFELDCGHDLVTAAEACVHSMKYRSVIGSGRVEFLEVPEEKRHALAQIMAHHTGKSDWTFPAEAMAQLCVFRLTVEHISGKANR